MLAPAKINLDLLITGRRDDGYHLLDSIVVFADYGDQLTAEISDQLSLDISGPFGENLTADQDNLILKAAKLIGEKANISPNVKFHLVKNLPISSGIGGGSADGAAALKLIIDLYELKISASELNEIALKLGADVPVCLFGKPVQMTGIGDKLNILKFTKEIDLLLVNPGVSVSTNQIFSKYNSLNNDFDQPRKFSDHDINLPFLVETLKQSKNALQAFAIENEKIINDVLMALSETEGAKITRMSGSGATCFALYEDFETCQLAAEGISRRNPKWWVKQVKVGTSKA